MRIPFVSPRNYSLEAEAVDPKLALAIARRVLAHSATTRHANTPAEQIKALEAIQDWEDLKINGDIAASRPTSAPIFDRSTLPNDVRARDLPA